MKLKFLFLFLISQTVFSQQKIIDSLSLLVKTPISDSIKIKAYGDLSWYYGNISIDSAFYYGNLALELSKETNHLIGEAQAYNDIGILHYRLGEFDNSISFYHKSLKIRDNLHDTLGMASLYNKLGIAYHRIFKMDSALIYDNKALNIYKKINHQQYIALINNNIANVYRGLKQYEKALNIHLEVVEIYKEGNNSSGLMDTYNNIGNSYLDLKDTLQTINYYKKAIEIGEENNYQRQLSALYNNYANILNNKGYYVEALEMYEKSYAIRESSNDKYGMASTAFNIGNLFLETNQINKAEKKIRFGLKLSKEINSKEQELDAYNFMIRFFAHKKNTDSILTYQNLYLITQDSLYNERVTKEIAEIQEKYDTAEREKEIAQQKEELLQQELEIKTKNLYSTLLGAGLLVLGLVIYFIYKKKQQLSKELELKDALATAQTQNRLQEQRLRISRDLHDNIGSQLTFIISSIDNLKFLAKSSDEKLKTKLASINDFASSTISQLRDTIWAMNKNEITFEDFHGRTLALIEKAKLSKENIKFSFNSSVKSNVVFSSVTGINIFRVLQEAINNALKYADASQIDIDITEQNKQLNIIISDNGKGFDLNRVDLGNGLENMQNRIEEIDGVITIDSKPNKGTSIKLEITKYT